MSLPRRLLFVLCLVCGCGGRGELETEREGLFSIVTNGAIQRDHHCEKVSSHEISTRNGFLPEAAVSALHSRIADTNLGDVERCLAEVQVYNTCFLDLPCSAFTSETALPAWLAGSSAAPCGCGVDDQSPPGPFAGPTLPKVLSSCIGLLPVAGLPPRPGLAASRPCAQSR
jgi:hypothetical protein